VLTGARRELAPRRHLCCHPPQRPVHARTALGTSPSAVDATKTTPRSSQNNPYHPPTTIYSLYSRIRVLW